jgi:predicted ATPase
MGPDSVGAMMDHTQPDFLQTALDPDLLSTPFRVQTKWHVITGAPSCGKTTLIDLLADRGYQIMPEVARHFMEAEIGRGRTIEQIHRDAAVLQRRIVDLQLQTEAGLEAAQVTFLDGGLPSSLAWFRAFGLDPNQILPECFHHRYASIFILDCLPTDLDGLRFDDLTIPVFLDHWQPLDYRALDYRPVRVPALPPEARLDFVLESLEERGLL